VTHPVGTGRVGIGTATRSLAVYRPGIRYYNLGQVDARVAPLPDWPRDRAR